MVFHSGTQIVTLVEVKAADGQMKHKGSVGVITKSPRDNEHAYRVRFPDGVEASIKRGCFSSRREALATNIKHGSQIAEPDFSDFVIYQCVGGSRAYGLENDESDTDLRGIFLPPAEIHWSLSGVPEQFEKKESEECYWEFQKFLTLALKANPNFMECRYTPLIEFASPLAEELLERGEHVFNVRARTVLEQVVFAVLGAVFLDKRRAPRTGVPGGPDWDLFLLANLA